MEILLHIASCFLEYCMIKNQKIDDDKNADGQQPRDDLHQDGLDKQPEKRTDLHFHQPLFQIDDDLLQMDARIRHDHARRAVDHALRRFKHAHHNRPCIGHDHDRERRFHQPLEHLEQIEVAHVVPLDHHAQQLDARHRRQDDARNRRDDGFREVFNHAKYAAVPLLRGHADHIGDLRHFIVDPVKQPAQVADNTGDQQLLEPFRNLHP